MNLFADEQHTGETPVPLMNLFANEQHTGETPVPLDGLAVITINPTNPTVFCQLVYPRIQYAVKLSSLSARADTRRCEKFSTQEATAEVFKGMGNRRNMDGRL